ncbi:hypothetical protein [Streptomyces luteireticuli]|uniref:hypothetical protein n=1 Tax=Streptomyces luteireticuli TaxID=173858 RepID=UPI003556D457
MTLQLSDLGSSLAVEPADWSVLDDPRVESVARAVARSIARDYGTTVEYEDAYQEAVIIAAQRAGYVHGLLAESGAGLLHRWLSQRLRDRWLTEVKRRSGHVSYEAVQRQAEASGL